jgi:DNA polymerase I
MSGNFGRFIVADFEYEVRGGDLPNVLCMVAHELNEHLQHVRTIRKWRDEFGSRPPFDVGDDTLFVAYSAWAEMTCFKVLGWRFPTHIFDLHTAYLAASNVLRPQVDEETTYRRPKKDLASACCTYAIEGWEGIDKSTIAQDIGEGRWENYGTAAVLEYCEEDVRMSVKLLRAQLVGNRTYPAADVERVLHWSNYSAKSTALIQAAGMPIDMPLWNLVQENKAAVVRSLIG